MFWAGLVIGLILGVLAGIFVLSLMKMGDND